MLNPAYVRLIQDQKEQELINLIEMKRRCTEGYACMAPVTPWYIHLARVITRSHVQKTESTVCCKAC